MLSSWGSSVRVSGKTLDKTGKTLDYCRGTPRESPADLQHYPAASPAENLYTKKKRPKPLSYFFGLLMGFVPWDIP